MDSVARFSIDGMTCQACASRIEKVLNKKDFISQATVNFASEEAQVSFDSALASVQEIAEIIAKAGFTASVKTDEQALANESLPTMSWRLWILLFINLLFLFGMVGMMLGRHDWMLPAKWQFVLATLVQFCFALPFYKSAWASLRGGLANMDVLVSIGTLAIYCYSTWMLFSATAHHGAEVYFEAGVMVIGFVSLGKFLEQRSKKSSLNALTLLLQLTPQQVTVQREGAWQRIALNQVQIGDVLRANHGERIAADGVVITGSAWMDESHLTGESQPEEKQIGSKVLAGALLSEGSIEYRAEQLGSQTLLGDMMQALSQAQGSKAPIARVADKVAAVFVPAVLAISAVTFVLTWYLTRNTTQALIHAVAVLVIACPCALGLATPAAIMVGMGKAVQQGIWFKDATALEEAAQVNVVVLDKTGTLTQGKPELLGIYVHDTQKTEAELLSLAAAVEQYARHPFAQALWQAAQAQQLHIPQAHEVQTIVGEGIQAQIEGIGQVKVGKAQWCKLVLPPEFAQRWHHVSIVAIALNDMPLGAFAFADALKPDSATAVAQLQALGIDVAIMSGDKHSVVQAVATQLGITHAQGEMSPRDKALAIQQLRAEGKIVAMVGDGINDAPALAAAQVSFAMKDGADAATHSASATLMQHSVMPVAKALSIAKMTLQNIKQNLFFAFIYNALGIPLAALGYLSPVIAGTAMAASSISVLGNALRLKRKRINE